MQAVLFLNMDSVSWCRVDESEFGAIYNSWYAVHRQWWLCAWLIWIEYWICCTCQSSFAARRNKSICSLAPRITGRTTIAWLENTYFYLWFRANKRNELPSARWDGEILFWTWEMHRERAPLQNRNADKRDHVPFRTEIIHSPHKDNDALNRALCSRSPINTAIYCV